MKARPTRGWCASGLAAHRASREGRADACRQRIKAHVLRADGTNARLVRASGHKDYRAQATDGPQARLVRIRACGPRRLGEDGTDARPVRVRAGGLTRLGGDGTDARWVRVRARGRPHPRCRSPAR
ncbi:hypothetical protein MFU01_41680 [Myxococcus fulvus]|uniref:Uncharacterized protein n=1 Tax=Myxococcus fulvus TaxID=33 RepID=A0A511T4N0_MYXFU|nr:hypothetical protein MFU01_41680 [Myxococcus fulvus]